MQRHSRRRSCCALLTQNALSPLSRKARPKSPIAYRIVHDPLGAAKVKEQKGASALVSVDRSKLSGTARVDLAVFGRNPGTGWGAPSYVSFSAIDMDAPYHDPALVPQPAPAEPQ